MPQNRSRIVLFLSLLLTFALVLSACGNNEPEPVGAPNAALVEEPAVDTESDAEVEAVAEAEVVEPEVAEAETEVEVIEPAAEVETAEVEVVEETEVVTETVETAAR